MSYIWVPAAPRDLAAAEAALNAHNEVAFCAAVTGAADLVLPCCAATRPTSTDTSVRDWAHWMQSARLRYRRCCAANLVALVRLNDGGDAVLKVCVPDPTVVDEIHAIAAAQGRGYVRLLAHDLSRYAMLQEPLGPSL